MEAALVLSPGGLVRPPWARPALVAAALVAAVSLVLPDLRPPLRRVASTVLLERTYDTVGGVRLEARTTSAGVNLRWTGIADPAFARWVLRRNDGLDSAVVATVASAAPGRFVDPLGEAGRHSYLLVAQDPSGGVLASSHVVAP